MKKDIGEISIIIPFYNAQKYIKACIASLENQTYPYFKAYFVDDGSTDDSLKLLKEYKDSRFVILRQEKAGVSAARNLGLEAASGDYLAFMDVDDELLPDYLEKLIEAAAENGADVVICGYVELYQDGRENEVTLPWRNTLLTREETDQRLLPLMISGDKKNRAINGSVCRTFINRRFWESTGIYFDCEVAIAEDLLFLLPVYNQAKRIYALRDCLYIYHQNVKSTINSYHADGWEEKKKFLEKFQVTLEEEHIYQQNIGRWQASESAMYTAEISNLARSPGFMDAYRKIRKLRVSLLAASVPFSQCAYLSGARKLSLWMLSHRMYLPLLILYRIKERYRLRNHLMG